MIPSSPFRYPFLLFCLAEASLLALGFGLSLGLGIPGPELLRWRVAHLIVGVAGTLPPCALLFWMLKTRWSPAVRLRLMVDATLKPLLCRMNLAQLLVLAALAGVAEEYLFRAFLQSFLGEMFGTMVGLVAASLIFGICHLATWLYGVYAAVLGAYLGAVMLYTGSLWPPVIIHALYDLIAFLWLLRDNPRATSGSDPHH